MTIEENEIYTEIGTASDKQDGIELNVESTHIKENACEYSEDDYEEMTTLKE